MSDTLVTEPSDVVAKPDQVPASTAARWRGVLTGLVVLAVLAVLPLVGLHIPVILPGPVSSPGSLQILAIGLVFAGVAVSYDVIFGYTGLLSLGHALYVAMGAYGTNLLMDRGLALLPAAALTVLGVAVMAALLGGIALRTRGVAFAMVTLAYAEAFSIFLLADPLRISGGEEGLPIIGDAVPDLLRGVVNTRNLYWLALIFAVIVYGLARLATRSLAGHVWQAIRENEDRVELLGLVPYVYKLASFVFGCSLAAAGGVVYLLLVRGSSPGVASAEFTLALVIMVVMGGAGRLWGAALGGVIYALLTLRLGALGNSGVLDGLPDWAERVLSEPLFVLGTLFVVLVLFAPGGLVGLAERARGSLRRSPS
ncbi:MAG TPA: branched-chain amino acid ABC transporter permease [Euzebya sp.]|nr:branched-chain amino acid ABC transporter permease [Euzebya sp.]